MAFAKEWPRSRTKPPACTDRFLTYVLGVGGLAETRQSLAQLRHAPYADVPDPLGLDLVNGLRPDRHGAHPAFGDADQARAGVGGVGGAFDITGAFELVDNETRGLLGNLRRLGELGQPAAFMTDALKNPRLRGGHVVVTGRGERLEYAIFQGAKGDVQQQPDVEIVEVPRDMN